MLECNAFNFMQGPELRDLHSLRQAGQWKPLFTVDVFQCGAVLRVALT